MTERTDCGQIISQDGQELGKTGGQPALREDIYGKGELAELEGRRWQEASPRHVRGEGQRRERWR